MSGAPTPFDLAATHPALAAFIDDRLTCASSRAIAREMAFCLLEAYARVVQPASPLGVMELEHAEAEAPQVNSADPVRGWMADLPLAGTADERREVSAVIGSLTHALEARRGGAAQPVPSRTESARAKLAHGERAAG